MQYELVLILNYADRHTELHQPPSLALRVPARVFLEQEKHLFFVRNRLALRNPSVNLMGLPWRMANIPFDRLKQHLLALLFQLINRLLSTLDRTRQRSR